MKRILCLFGFHQFDNRKLTCEYHKGIYYYKNICIHCGKEYTDAIEEKFIFPPKKSTNNEDLYTTDYNKCRENGVRAMILRYINQIEWDKLETKELEKLYILIGNELESYCQKNKLYDCKKYDCPYYSEEVDPDQDPCITCIKKST